MRERGDSARETVPGTVSAIVRALVAWFVLLAAMIGNGLVRALVLEPWLGEPAARRASSAIGAAIVFGLAGVFVRRWWAGAPRRRLLGVGLLWGALTVAFEFGFGRLFSGLSWEDLLADYDVTRGRLWPLVLAATVVSPVAWGWRAR